MPIVSFIQAKDIIDAIDEGKHKARILMDLGLTPMTVDINHKFKEIRFSGVKVTFKELVEIMNDETTCYSAEKNKGLQKLKMFSADTGKFYKLVPSKDAPTVEISGVKMHSIFDRTPWQDTLDKISSIAPIKGRVLDTCCCLGYTAIAAAKDSLVTQVFTFERDSNVLEFTDYNPWSKDLYLNRKIKLTIGDVARGIEMFSVGFFNSIIHDPSPFEMSSDLYSLDFYKKLYRVLKTNGKLFHYIGEGNQDLAEDVIKRLKAVGFKYVKEQPDILGVIAQK